MKINKFIFLLWLLTAISPSSATIFYSKNEAMELAFGMALAFHEPPEYQPPQRWFEQLYKRPLADMDFNKSVDGISSATLSTRSALNSIRKVMAIYQAMVKNKSAN